MGKPAGGRAQPTAWCCGSGSTARDWDRLRTGWGTSWQGTCLAFACVLCCPCGSVTRGPGGRRLPWGLGRQEAALGHPQTGAGALLPRGTEEAHGGAGPALLLPRGGSGGGGRAGCGKAPHSDPDNQGAAAEQRHRRTLQGPGSHAAKVGWLLR